MDYFRDLRAVWIVDARAGRNLILICKGSCFTQQVF
jgi:hypothetical protein